MMKTSGRLTGSRASTEPEVVSALTGFDPGRMNASWLVTLISDYGGAYSAGTFCDSKTFHARYPEFVSVRNEHKARGDRPTEAMVAALVDFADAIATEARRAETPKSGSVADEGAGSKSIARKGQP